MGLRRVMPFVPLLVAMACANGVATDSTGTINETLIGTGPFGFHPVPAANARTPGVSSPNALPPQFIETPVAQGSNAVENPVTVTLASGATTTVTHYAYDGDGPR